MSESKNDERYSACALVHFFTRKIHFGMYVFITALDTDDTRIATYSSSSHNTFTFNGSVRR